MMMSIINLVMFQLVHKATVMLETRSLVSLIHV